MRPRRVRETSPAASRRSTKRKAARIGPTVCELDGPMPILKRSKTLTVMVDSLLLGLRCPGKRDWRGTQPVPALVFELFAGWVIGRPQPDSRGYQLPADVDLIPSGPGELGRHGISRRIAQVGQTK